MSARGDAVPLRLAAGLHALALDGADRRIAALWPAPETMPDRPLWEGLSAVMADHEPHLLDWLERAPQTNEVARSAVLIAAASHLERPMVLSELGAAAGLNLLFDHWRLEGPGWARGPAASRVVLRPDWTGPAPGAHPVEIVARAGVDLHPRDPVTDRLRLMAYVWADQPARLARLSASLDLCAQIRPDVARDDATHWLAKRLATPFPGCVHLVFHTIAWQYFPPEAQRRGEALLAEAGARATPDAPLARLAFEADGRRDGAAITLTQWPGGDVRTLGRADFHGRWVRWEAAAPGSGPAASTVLP